MSWSGGSGGGQTDGQAGRRTPSLERGRGESYLPPDVCELGEEQGQVEGELQDVVVVDVHRQRLRRHTAAAKV